MTTTAATVTYSIPEEFEPALHALRGALTGNDLGIAGELDLSGHLERSLRIKLAPCMVLYIWPSAGFLESNQVSAAAVLLLPLHVVVSGHGGRTEIHVLRSSALEGERVMAPVRKLQAELTQALEKIAMRLTLVI